MKKNFFNSQNWKILVGLLTATIIFPHFSLANNKLNKPIQQHSFAVNPAKELNWIPDRYANVCHGYFIQPILSPFENSSLTPNDNLTRISANTSTLSPKGQSELSGNVMVTQPGRQLNANKAIIYADHNGKYQIIQLFGNVRAYENGKFFLAKSARFNLHNKSGTLHDVLYRFVLAPESQTAMHLSRLNNKEDKITGTVAWGHAKEVHQIKPKHSILKKVTYTTCAPNDAQWHLIASKIKLNRKTQMGTAENVRLHVGNIPIFYWPYLNFPLTKARKSGFLFPIVGSTNVSGFSFGLPYYWNIAPNYDDTITPTLYSERGVMVSNKFRYLTEKDSGKLLTSFLPDDRKFKKFQQTAPTQFAGQPGLDDLLNASDNRYSLIWQDNTNFTPKWNGYVDYARVSDDYYLQDFGNIPEEIATNQLLQKTGVQYTDEHWTFNGLLQGYQTLHPVNRQPLGDAYSELPDLSLAGTYPDIWHGFGLTWQSHATYFYKPNEVNIPPSVTGGRFQMRPGIDHPFNWIWGFFDPKLQYDITYYSLKNQIPPANNQLTRALPILDLDSGLFFQRPMKLFGQPYQQTLEPRLDYLYIPFRNQNDYPNFDSGIIPFTYSQLFAENRFSGLDRIGDANRLSYSLTTRFINSQTGKQKFRFSIGQIYYFEEPLVQLTRNPTPENNDFLTGLGAAPNNERFSPIATLLSYNITPNLALNGGDAWDPSVRKNITSSLYLSYNPAYNHIIDVGYSFTRNGDIINTQELGSSENNLNQFSIDSAWPITNRWSAVEIFNYNISQTHIQSYLGGLEYNSCCFRIRLVGGKVFSSVDQNGKYQFQNAIYFQIQLKGLGNIGTNSISSLLTSNINGYDDPFQSNSFGNLQI